MLVTVVRLIKILMTPHTLCIDVVNEGVWVDMKRYGRCVSRALSYTEANRRTSCLSNQQYKHNGCERGTIVHVRNS